MRLLLIRHGQSANNAGPDHQRVNDPGLTEIGEKQAQLAAELLSQTNIDHLYCSPFLRALETTRPIADRMRLRVQVHPHIFEQGGCYDGHEGTQKTGAAGLGRSAIERDYPGWEIHPEIPETGWWGYRPYESAQECAARAARVANWITHELTPIAGSHAMVIHADFKALLIPAILALSSRQHHWTEPLRNTGITELQWNDGWQLVSFNQVQHLSEDLVTY